MALARVVGEDGVDRAPSVVGQGRTPGAVVGKVQDSHRQPPGAPARPGRLVDGHGGPERGTAVRIEQGPGHLKFAGGIARAQAAPVDHAAEPSGPRQQVSGAEVAVDPHRRAIPRRGLGVGLPRRRHQADVVQVREPGEAFADRAPPLRQLRAAAVVVRSGARAIGEPGHDEIDGFISGPSAGDFGGSSCWRGLATA